LWYSIVAQWYWAFHAIIRGPISGGPVNPARRNSRCVGPLVRALWPDARGAGGHAARRPSLDLRRTRSGWLSPRWPSWAAPAGVRTSLAPPPAPVTRRRGRSIRHRSLQNGSVTEPSPPSRHAPSSPRAAIKDLTLLVRVPGRPEDVRAFTDAERDEAAAYAAETGGITEDLPV